MTVTIFFFDAKTEEQLEIENLNDFNAEACPSVGDEIHYWQDGTSDAAWKESGISFDFLVKKVGHEFRHMPGRGGTIGRDVHYIMLYVEEIKKQK